MWPAIGVGPGPSLLAGTSRLPTRRHPVATDAPQVTDGPQPSSRASNDGKPGFGTPMSTADMGAGSSSFSGMR